MALRFGARRGRVGQRVVSASCRVEWMRLFFPTCGFVRYICRALSVFGVLIDCAIFILYSIFRVLGSRLVVGRRLVRVCVFYPDVWRLALFWLTSHLPPLALVLRSRILADGDAMTDVCC